MAGVALNCVANGRLLRESPFDDIWIQPAAGDAGGALGAAVFTWHQLLEHPRAARTTDVQKGSYLGPQSTTAEVTAFLDSARVKYWRAPSEPALLERVVDLLGQDKIVGWCQGRMELDHALGAEHSGRSAIAEDAGDDD